MINGGLLMSLWNKIKFKNWSISNKLIFSFLFINLLSISITSFLQYEKNRAFLRNNTWLSELPLSKLNTLDIEKEQLWISLIIAGITAIIIIIISSFIKDTICRPISRLMYAVNEIRKGNMDVMVEINTTEEFGALSEAFNQMIRELKYSQEKLGLTNKNLEKIYKELEKSNAHLQKTQEMAIHGLSKLAESRDPDTGAHIKRMQYYAKLIAIEIKNQEKFKDKIDENFINDIYTSSALHDVGKVGVPDAVLLKPGKLEPYERSIIETHTVIGGNALRAYPKS